jgi:hypothetical protein
MSDPTSSKKRKALDKDSVDIDGQIPNDNGAEQCDGLNPCHVNEEADEALPSLAQDMLEVPLEYIFREVASSTSFPSQTSPNVNAKRKPLLSRSEAQCLVQLNLLAHEIDSLTSISAEALQQKLFCSEFAASLNRVGNPYLRPLLPILHTLEHKVSTESLNYVSTTMDRIVGDLQRTIDQLRQSSEQNWTLYETLLDSAGDMGRALAEEKRRLSDIQEELCHRIEYILADSSKNDNADSNLDSRPDPSTMESMKDYCDRLFLGQSANRQDTTTNDNDEVLEEPYSTALSAVSSPANSPAATKRASRSAQVDSLHGSQESRSDARPATGGTSLRKQDILASSTRLFEPHRLMEKPPEAAAAPEEKENAPSQSSSQHSSQHRSPSVFSVLETATRTTPRYHKSQLENKSLLETVAAANGTPPESGDGVGGDDDDDDDVGFQSQGAAHVLSTLASSVRAGVQRSEQSSM